MNGTTTAYAPFSFTKARFTYTPNNVAANDTVFFDASSSNSTGYSWAFGDNDNGTGIAPTHTYTKTLTVTSTVGTARTAQIIHLGTNQNNISGILLLISCPLPIFLYWHRKKLNFIIIQVRIPPPHKKQFPLPRRRD